MSDTIDALREVLDDAIHALEGGDLTGGLGAVHVARERLGTASEGLSIVKTADWERMAVPMASRPDAMTTPRPEALTAEGTCWFCKGAFVVDALIAGYDTFDEQRLACLACNERMQGNWSLATALAPLPGTCGCTCCLGHLVLVSARYECNGGCGCSASPAGLPRQKAKRIDWSNVVVDEGDEAP